MTVLLPMSTQMAAMRARTMRVVVAMSALLTDVVVDVVVGAVVVQRAVIPRLMVTLTEPLHRLLRMRRHRQLHPSLRKWSKTTWSMRMTFRKFLRDCPMTFLNFPVAGRIRRTTMMKKLMLTTETRLLESLAKRGGALGAVVVTEMMKIVRPLENVPRSSSTQIPIR